MKAGSSLTISTGHGGVVPGQILTDNYGDRFVIISVDSAATLTIRPYRWYDTVFAWLRSKTNWTWHIKVPGLEYNTIGHRSMVKFGYNPQGTEPRNYLYALGMHAIGLRIAGKDLFAWRW